MCTVCGCGDVSITTETAAVNAHAHSHEHAHSHDHAHSHEHEHEHADGTRHSHPHAHSHTHVHAHAHSHDHGAHEHTHADLHSREGAPHDHDHDHLHGGVHPRDGDHVHLPDGTVHYGRGEAGVSVGGMSQSRILKIETDILAKNDVHASENRRRFAAAGVFAVNLVSSPGSGKTSLLVRVISDLAGALPVAVIEGDQQTANDAERIRATGAPAVQINTGKGCHLDAHMIGHALDRVPMREGGVLFIENVGNLVCPAAFDLGEAHKVVVLSVTEGEDKPLKYPDMFAAADLMLVNKSDLLPHVDFDVSACVAAAQRVNPRLKTLVVSARTGEGLGAFRAWLEAGAATARASAAAARSSPRAGTAT